MSEHAHGVIKYEHTCNRVPTNIALVYNLVANCIKHVELKLIVCQDEEVARHDRRFYSLVVNLL